MRLSEFFATVAPFLEGRATHAEAVKALYGEPRGQAEVDARRLALYGRFARAHRFEVVDSLYPHVRRTVLARGGDGAWDALVETYFRRHPMLHFELNANGLHLPEFLQGYATEAKLPEWLAELADFEWWEWQAIIAPNEPAGGPGPRLSNTVELRPYAHALVEWLATPEEERPEEPTAERSLVLFWRTPDFELRREPTSPMELLVLKAVSEGQPLRDTAKGSGVPYATLEETLRDLASAGIILGAG